MFENFNIDEILKKMKYGVGLCVVIMAFSIFQLCTDSNYRASVKFLKDNYNINEGCGKTKNVTMSIANTNKGTYIFDVEWEFGCKKSVFIHTDTKTNKVIEYKLITEDSDRCHYYGQVSEKYECK